MTMINGKFIETLRYHRLKKNEIVAGKDIPKQIEAEMSKSAAHTQPEFSAS